MNFKPASNLPGCLLRLDVSAAMFDSQLLPGNQRKYYLFCFLWLETVDLEAILKEGLDDDDDDIAKEGIVDTEDQSQDNTPVKRVNFDSAENTVETYTEEASDDSCLEDDFITACHESEDTFDEVIREKEKEPNKSFGLRRTASRAAPGTVKKLMARFQNP